MNENLCVRLRRFVGRYTASVHEVAVVVVGCDYAVGISLGSVRLGCIGIHLCQTHCCTEHQRVSQLLELGNITVVEELLCAE